MSEAPNVRFPPLLAINDPLRSLGTLCSKRHMATVSASSRELWTGLATLFALGLATLAFGFDNVGRFCLFAAVALPAANAMRKGRFHFVLGRYTLVRATDPRGFWTAIVLFTALASVMLWSFVDGLLR